MVQMCYIMGESTSVFIRRFVKLKCAYRDLCILTVSRIKRIKKKCFVSISFRNLVWSIHLTTCRSMFSEANACARVARSGENCCELAGSLLYTTEKSRAVRKNNNTCLSEGNELSVAIDKNVKNKWNWEWIQEVDADGVLFRLMLKVRWAKGCN